MDRPIVYLVLHQQSDANVCGNERQFDVRPQNKWSDAQLQSTRSAKWFYQKKLQPVKNGNIPVTKFLAISMKSTGGRL